MDVIRGKKAYIEFYKEDEFRKYGCLQTFTFEETIETKSVKTKGDGYKRRYRGQSVSATISLSGLIMFNDSAFTSPFDLIEYCNQMTDIEFTIYFDDESGTHVNAIYGKALVTTGSLGGDVSFGRSSFTLQCNEWTIGLPPVCTKSITSHTVTRQGLTYIYRVAILTLNSGTVPRYDWRLDGGAINSSFDTGWPINVQTSSSFLFGSHTLDIWPVCDNGARGEKLTRNFTVPFG